MHYTYRIAWSEEDGEYVAIAEEFPSLSWIESDPVDALRGLALLLRNVEVSLERERCAKELPAAGITIRRPMRDIEPD